MKIVTSCPSRFHIFDQALQLQKRNMLAGIITEYPISKARQWGLERDHIISYPIDGVSRLIFNKGSKYIPKRLESRLREKLFSRFSNAVKKSLPVDADVFIGLSAFCQETLDYAKTNKLVTIVDHGSLHERKEGYLLEKECEEYGFQKYGNWQYEWLLEREDREFKEADFVFVCSDLAKNTMIEYGVQESKIFANPLGVDLSSFYPLEIRKDIFRIIHVSNMSPRKGIHYLLQAYSELNLPGAELWLVGTPPKDPVLRKIVKKYVNEGKGVKVMGAFPQKELNKLYNQSSVFVLPSLADGWGMVVLQAMACELPVILTQQTGAAEAVKDGESGLIVKAQSTDAIKEAILKLYSDAELRVSLGKHACKKVQSGYTWDDYGARLVQFLTNTL